jgi:uncharacterized protein YpmB
VPAQNSSKQMGKKGRQARILKRERQKKIIILSVCALFVVISVVVFFSIVFQQSQERVFTDGHQAIILHDDGSFTAELAHETRIGTYVESVANDDGVVTVLFISDGISVTSSIVDNILVIPPEWQDDHGHGTELRLK